MSRTLSIIYYGIKSYLRHKDVLFWVIAWPILWLLLVAYVFVPPTGGVEVRVAIIDCDQGLQSNVTAWTPLYSGEEVNLTNEVVSVFKQASGVKATYMVDVVGCRCSNKSSCRDYAKGLLIKKGYDIAVLVPENASEYYVNWIPVNLTVYIKASTPNEEYLGYGYALSPLFNLTMNSTLERIDRATEFVSNYTKYSTPSNVTYNMTGAEYSRYIRFFFYSIVFPVNPSIDIVKPRTMVDRPGVVGWTTIGAIGLALMTGLLTAGAGFFVFRSESGYLKRLLASSISLRKLLLIDLVENLIISLIVSAIIVAVGVAIGARILFNPLDPLHYIAVVFILLAALFAYGLGLLLAPITRSSRATGGATAIGLILVFLTGIWWPPKQMLPQPLRAFAYVFPPSCAFDVVRDIVVWGKSLVDTLWNMEAAIIGTIILYVIIALVYHSRLEKFAEKVLE